MKKFFLSVTVLLIVSLFLIGCGGEDGVLGPTGSDAPIYLSGEQTFEGINHALASGAPVVFAGVVQSNNGTVIIPAGKGVTLVGDPAYSAGSGISATLIVSDGASISSASTGKIAKGNGTALAVVAPESVLSVRVTPGAGLTTYPVYNSVEDVATAGGGGTTVAVTGPVSVVGTGTSAGKTITAADLTSVTALFYVVGDLTVSADLTTTPLYVTGKTTFTAAQTALKALTAGSVESSAAITGTSNADITVTGELKTTGTTSNVALTGSGALTAGSLNLSGNLTTVTGTVTVKGASVLGGDITRGTSGAYHFGGDVTIADGKKIALTSTDTLTLAGGASIKAGANTVLSASGGDVAITPATGAVLTAAAASKKIGVSTAGIAFTGTLVVSGELEATAKPITVTTGTGILAVAPGGKITTTGATDAGAILLGGAANSVTLTGAGSWTAGGSRVNLTQTAANAVSITKTGSAAATFTASGTPTITVLGGDGSANVLTLGGGTEIALGGNGTKVGAISVVNNDTASKILFAAAGAKISTGLAAATTKVTTVAGGITANSGTVGSKLEVFSTGASGSSLKLGSIIPASDANFDGTDNVLTGPSATAATSIDGALTVTAG
ncbi:MAG: hypothetical protein LBG27_10405 [Spirochaetaceae bacterium]|jgi:fibronectin-binding autotransporter adhesin|nr:hypothetical protein [Spirochaetaceae bacterium]